MEYSIKFHTEMKRVLLFNPGKEALFIVRRENGSRSKVWKNVWDVLNVTADVHQFIQS